MEKASSRRESNNFRELMEEAGGRRKVQKSQRAHERFLL